MHRRLLGQRVAFGGQLVVVGAYVPLPDGGHGYRVHAPGFPANDAIVREGAIAGVVERAGDPFPLPFPRRALLRVPAREPVHKEKPMPIAFTPLPSSAFEDKEDKVVEAAEPEPEPLPDLLALEPLDRGKALLDLIEERGWSQAELARQVGLTKNMISRLTRLAAAPEEVQETYRSGQMNMNEALAELARREEAARTVGRAIVDDATAEALALDVAALRAELCDVEAERDEALQRVKALKEEIETRDGEIDAMRRRIDELTRGGKELHRLADNAVVRAAKAEQEAAQFREKLEAAEETIRAQRREIEEVRGRYAELARANGSLGGALEKIERERMVGRVQAAMGPAAITINVQPGAIVLIGGEHG